MIFHTIYLLKNFICGLSSQMSQVLKRITETTDCLARPLAATKFEIQISKYETISNGKKLNAQNFM